MPDGGAGMDILGRTLAFRAKDALGGESGGVEREGAADELKVEGFVCQLLWRGVSASALS